MDIKIVSPTVSKVAQKVVENLPKGGKCLIIFDDKFFDLTHESIENLITSSYEEVLNIIRSAVDIGHDNRYIYLCCYDACLEKVFFITKENRDALFLCKTSDL